MLIVDDSSSFVIGASLSQLEWEEGAWHGMDKVHIDLSFWLSVDLAGNIIVIEKTPKRKKIKINIKQKA